MKDTLKVQIASVSDREGLVAEIWCGDYQLAELSYENEVFLLEIYPNLQSKDGRWSIEFDNFIDVMNELKDKLLNLQ